MVVASNVIRAHKQVMKKLLIIISVLIVCAVMCLIALIFLQSSSHVVAERTAVLNPDEGAISCYVSGYVRALLTPEGPYPKWSHRVKILLHPGKKIPATGRVTFHAGTDFTTLGNKITSGTIIIDRSMQIVELNVTYAKSYQWSKCNGRFQIKRQ